MMSNVGLIDGHIDNAEHCVCCGAVIPEGRQVCIICGLKTNYKQPAADVVEVKHGFWEQGDYYDMGDVCSECGYDSFREPCNYNYCPHCGAKMDGKDGE